MNTSKKYKAEFAAMEVNLHALKIKTDKRVLDFTELMIDELAALEEMCNEPIIAAAFEQSKHNREMRDRILQLEKDVSALERRY